MDLHHFQCPECGRLCSVPWNAAWCLHSETVQPSPPSYKDTDWTRMLPVNKVETDPLPLEANVWYVQEHRNQYGYPDNQIPGEDKRAVKTVAGPMTREEAYAFAQSAPRDNVPKHIHGFRPLPGDLVREYDE